MAAAGPHDHVPVFLQDDVGAVVEVEDRDGVELSWSAAGLGHRIWVDKVDQCLHDGVVGSIHVGVQREGTFPLTVVRGIAFGRDDPVLPSQVSEADVKLVLLTGLPLVTAAVFCMTGSRTAECTEEKETHMKISWA